jgi:hypothetical protein
MCRLGDLVLTWDAKDDATIEPLLQTLLDQGVVFFITRKRKLHRVEKITQATAARNISLPTAAWNRLLGAGAISLIAAAAIASEETTGETADTPAAIIENDTIGVTPPQGG